MRGVVRAGRRAALTERAPRGPWRDAAPCSARPPHPRVSWRRSPGVKFHAWRAGSVPGGPGRGELTVKGPGVLSAGLSRTRACSACREAGPRVAGRQCQGGLPRALLHPRFLLETPHRRKRSGRADSRQPGVRGRGGAEHLPLRVEKRSEGARRQTAGPAERRTRRCFSRNAREDGASTPAGTPEPRADGGKQARPEHRWQRRRLEASSAAGGVAGVTEPHV